jgi:hypothetical protein
MTFRICKQYATGVIKKIAAGRIIFRQNRWHELLCTEFMNTPSVSARLMGAVIVLAMSLFVATRAAAQNYYTTNGTEYPIIGHLPGDQMYPDVALSQNGGFVVWQDNITDGSGWGISAQQVNSTLSGSLSPFRVNVTGLNDQENPRVALLKNGGAAFVWQGGSEGYQHIYARFLNTNNTFLATTDELVSLFPDTNSFQINPAIATLSNSNVVIVWASYNQAGPNTMQDVYAKIFSPSGIIVSNGFLVNQFTDFNQRSPAVAALTNGGFVVAWVSEQERNLAPNLGANTNYTASSSTTTPSVDIYARIYGNNGASPGNEFLVNTNSNPCANPSVAAAADDSFLIGWTERDMVNQNNSLDVYARLFNSSATGGAIERVNSHVYGDQYVPRISVINGDYLVVWTSLGQDGSREGVYGQFLREDGSFVGAEFRVNTTTVSQQMQPAVASDGVDQFLVVWTSYTGNSTGFDLYAQRYVNVSAVLNPMPAPFVYAPFTLVNGNYQPQLVVSWAPLLGIAISNYQVFVDGSPTAMGVVLTNEWTMTAANGLTTSSTHSFQVAYSTSAGVSPPSSATSGTTWGGVKWGDVPFEWMEATFGTDASTWPAPGARVGPGGPTLYQAFLAGATTDPSTWLQQTLTQTAQGMFLTWNTTPGATYQVQSSSNTVSWTNFGSPRFEAGTSDSLYVGGGSSGFYRVVLLRQ